MKQYIEKVKRLTRLKNPFILIALIMFPAGCVKVTLYDTDHPNHGKITLQTTWNDRGEGVAIPVSHVARIGEHTTELAGEKNTLDHHFPEGHHHIHIYNVSENVDVSGTTATANYAAGDLGWFFSGKDAVVITKDKHHEVTVAMRQQVRRLTLELEITGNAADRITAIDATVTGIAGAIDIENGNPTGMASTVNPVFTKTDNKYTASMNLLGVVGSGQTITLNLYAQDGTVAAYTLTSDLSEKLKDFNADKKMPLTLRTEAGVALAASGFTATIDDWSSENSGNANAD